MISTPTKRGQSPFGRKVPERHETRMLWHFCSKRALTPFWLLLIGSGAAAQQAVIDHCKQTSSDADRIACLEAALLGKEVAAPAPNEAEPRESTAEVLEEELSGERIVASAAPEGIGAEQVAARTQTREEQEDALEKELGLVVAKYEWVPYERLVVTFENGQVWRQIKGDVTRIRTSLERNQTADITESGLGGYKLRLNEIRRTIRVERIR